MAKLIRSFSGKARRVHPIAQRGQKIVVIADDNGRTLIVPRYRLHSDSLIMTSERTTAPTAEELALLERLLAINTARTKGLCNGQ
jgi:hypothetical protein